MIWNLAVASVLLVGLSLPGGVPGGALGQPAHPAPDRDRATRSPTGNFGGRVDLQGLSFEFADLAEDFNRMSGHVGRYVQQLRQAAQVNRDLFIGSLRAFVAAIDAKDPYTRGHSERVAAVSRIIARYLGLPEEVQHKIWIGALLHDVGKIGVEDQVLRKAGKLLGRGVRADEAAHGDGRRDHDSHRAAPGDDPGHPVAPRGLERPRLSGRPQGRADPALRPHRRRRRHVRRHHHQPALPAGLQPAVRGRDDHPPHRQPLRRQGRDRLPPRLRGRRDPRRAARPCAGARGHDVEVQGAGGQRSRRRGPRT